MKFKRPSFFLIAIYAAILVVGLLLISKMNTTHDVIDNIRIAEVGQEIGPKNADRVIVEFMDYRCSYCRELHTVISELQEKHPDIRVVFRHYPAFGKVSLKEAEIALSAAILGQFETFHTQLMSHNDPISDMEVQLIASSVGIDYDQLTENQLNAKIGPILLKNVDAAEALQINSLPAIIVNRKVILVQDIPTLEELEKILDEEYK